MNFLYDQHLLDGYVCLHPTGSLWGLTALGAESTTKLAQLKGRPSSKRFIYLVPSLKMACEIWSPLPHQWLTLLQSIWPAALSVVWKKNPTHPFTDHCAESSPTIALRIDPTHDHPWFGASLIRLQSPLPTTSVNLTNQMPIDQKNDMIEFAKQHHVYIPPAFFKYDLRLGAVSTIIEICGDSEYKILREGAIRSSHVCVMLSPKLCINPT